MLLSINIPTYERMDSFSAIIIELEKELNKLIKKYKDLIQIRVIDNNSNCKIEKELFCFKISNRSDIKIFYSINNENIGADRNIFKCCSASPEAKFTWVLGDDDHIIPDSIPQILSILLDQESNLGLLILTSNDYAYSEILKGKIFNSYESFARTAINEQPHLLIAHTLISCNIFRTDIFDKDEAIYVLEELTPRSGLVANFVHMRGIIKGLFRNKITCTVILNNIPSLDTTRRLPSFDNVNIHIFKIYYFYFLWILIELGINIKQVRHDESMRWLY